MSKTNYTELDEALADLFYTSALDTDVWVHRDKDVKHDNLSNCPCNPIRLARDSFITLTEFRREYFRQLGS